MLRRIGLQNFKCWRELDIELAPITLFFGVNSSGKTSVLQSLLLLKQTVASRDPKEHLNFGGEPSDYAELGSYHDLIYEHDPTGDLHLSLHWDLTHEAIEELAVAGWVEDKTDKRTLYPSMSMSYEASWGFEHEISLKRLEYTLFEENRDTDKLVATRQQDNQYRLSHFHRDTLGSSIHFVEYETKLISAPYNSHLFSDGFILQAVGSHVTTSTMYISVQLGRLLQRLYYLGPLRQYPRRIYSWTGGTPSLIDPDGANTMEMLISSARNDGTLLNKTENRLRSLDLVDGFSVKPIDQDQRRFEAIATIGGVESSLRDVGFGVAQVLPAVAMLLSAPEGSIVLLEQPELHLHPNAQAALADLLLDVAEKRNLQLIVESHSEYIVRRLQRRIAEAKHSYATTGKIKMYYCEPGESGSTANEVKLDRFGQISKWPKRFLGDISGDIHSMAKAAIQRRRQELERVGSGD